MGGIAVPEAFGKFAGSTPAVGFSSSVLVVRGRAGVPPAGLATSKSVFALLDLPFAPRQRAEPGAEVCLGCVDAALALGEATVVRKEPLLARVDLVGAPTELFILFPELALSRRER